MPPMNLLQIPKPVATTVTLQGHHWTLSGYEEDLGILEPAALAELETHLAPGLKENFRLQLTLQGIPFLVGFLVKEREIVLASPKLAWELFLLEETRDQKVPGVYSWHLLEEHIEKIQSIDLNQSPTVIERITARYNLPDFFADTDLKVLSQKAKQLEEKLDLKLRRTHRSFFEKISDAMLKLTANYALFRIYLLKFVAMLPSLDHDKKGKEVKKAYLETLRRVIHDSRWARQKNKTGQESPLPAWLLWILRLEHFAAQGTPAWVLAKNIRFAVRLMAKRFIAGESIEKAAQVFQSLRKTHRDATLDQLGEQVVSEKEASHYCSEVLKLIRGLSLHVKKGEKNSAGILRAHLSIKVSALASDFRAQAPEYVFKQVAPRLKEILQTAKEHEVFINIDAEHYAYRDLVFYIYRRVLLETPALKDYQAIGIALQAYLRDAYKHFSEILALAKERGLTMPVRLVKGAYWDQETIEAEAAGFDPPQFLNKEETDIHCRQLIIKILEAAPHLQLCLGSHNLADHCFAETVREEKFPNAPMIEHQCLHMTYEALSKGMAKMGWPHHLSIGPKGQPPSSVGQVVGWAVRNYVPIGSLLVGMAYLVRRIMENSSQVGILVQMRETKGTAPVEFPHVIHLQKKQAGQIVWDRSITNRSPTGLQSDFVNTIPLRFYLRKEKTALDQTFKTFTETSLGLDYSQNNYSGVVHKIFSPSQVETFVGQIQYANLEEAKGAVEKSYLAYTQGEWARAAPIERASVLLKAAHLMLLQRLELTSLMVHEGGKNFYEATHDVNEAIDFLNFYAREACRIARSNPTQVSRGPFAVISPWNFPLAIPAGMAVGALAAGNTVLLKPAEHTPLITQRLADILHEAGVPEDVFIHLPGKGSEVGKLLVEHPKIAGIVFTGSKEIGLWIAHTAGKRMVRNELFGFTAPAKVITEMGGKNAILVTANAELDETVAGILYSAFGNAGQKCSACSRVLVDQAVQKKLAERLTEACRDLKVGPAFDHATFMNPLIARKEKERLHQEAEEVLREARLYGGNILLDRSKENLPGCCMGPLVVELPANRALQAVSYAKKELFGPILHVIRFKNLDEAAMLFNSTEYGLTGGIFSQSQDEVEYLSPLLEAGNIYVNRSITGARVAIEPFGGFKLSGTGPKVGSPFYLEAFHHYLEPTERQSKSLSDITVEDLQQYRTWIAKAVGYFRSKYYWNRNIPGQLSFNDLTFVKQNGIYIASLGEGSEDQPNVKTFFYLLAALAVGSRLKVLCRTDKAYAMWSRIENNFRNQGFPKENISVLSSDAAQIQKALRETDLHFLIVEGNAEEVRTILELVYNGKRDEKRICSVLTKLDAPDIRDFEKYLEKFVEVRSFAVNVMRYGAPLEVGL